MARLQSEKWTYRLALLAGASGCFLSAPAFAQDAPVANAANDEIVVTAQRREEALQDVPIQVSAFSAQAIEDAGITSTAEFIQLVPNISFDQSFTYLNSFVTVRGVAQINNANSPVSVIVDGVPQNNQKQLSMNLFDIERIEVLRGPQGGLYGRNAIGGAINIITQAPSDVLEGGVTATFGTGDARTLTGNLAGPFGESGAAFRLAGSWHEDDGRIENRFLGEDVDTVDHDGEVRARITLPLGSSLRMDARVSYRDFEAGSIYDSQIDSGEADDYQQPSENMLGSTFGDITDASLKFDWSLGRYTLTSITGRTELNEAYRGDLDFGNSTDDPGGFLGLGFQAGQGQDLIVALTSQEFRLVSPDEDRFRWILGAFYLQTDRALRTRVFIDLDGTHDQIDDPALGLADLNESNDNRAYALYGQFDYDLTDALTLSGSLRYDEDQREQTDVNTSAVREQSFDSVQPKLTLTYHTSPDSLVYATYSTGFRSGGFNAPTTIVPVYAAEELTNYEIGFKSSWFDRRLILNGAAYYAEDENFQYFFIDIATGSQLISNIDQVTISGIELEAQWRVTPGLSIFGSIGTTDSEIEEFAAFPGFVGNRTPKTTEWSSNVGAQYEWALGGNWSGLARADWEHSSDKYWQIDNLDVQEPIDLVTLRFGVSNPDWALFVTGRNVLEETYYADLNPTEFSGLDVDIGFLAQPMAWSLELSRRF